jgi:hypothetical protein
LRPSDTDISLILPKFSYALADYFAEKRIIIKEIGLRTDPKQPKTGRHEENVPVSPFTGRICGESNAERILRRHRLAINLSINNLFRESVKLLIPHGVRVGQQYSPSVRRRTSLLLHVCRRHRHRLRRVGRYLKQIPVLRL